MQCNSLSRDVVHTCTTLQVFEKILPYDCTFVLHNILLHAKLRMMVVWYFYTYQQGT